MARKKSYITITDQFCGAGGSSIGAKKILDKIGGEVKLALNHWKLAIETHQTNFPETAHDCTDISACDPRYYDSTDILITSPECTNHSLAKGVKIVKKQMDLFNSGKIDASAERSRATMWDVCRFAEIHKYNAIIVENVVDARKWVLFDAWLKAMYDLGYLHKTVYLNSMHCHPTPQSRDRMYVVFWKKKNKAPVLDYSPAAYCAKCGKNTNAVQTWKKQDVKYGKYKQQYVYCCAVCASVVEPYYYAAFNCIDWSDIGTRIGDRTKPLSENTIKRIEYGLKKYGNQPLVVSNYSPGYTIPLNKPTGSVTCNDHHGLVNPFIIHRSYSKEARGVWRSVSQPTFTQTSLESQALVTPFIIKSEHSHGEPSGKVKSSVDPMQTQTTRQSIGLLTPMLIKLNRTGKASHIKEPTSTFTGGGINHGILNTPFIVENKGQSKARSITDPAACQTAKQYLGLITNEAWNAFLSYNYNSVQTSNITEATDGVNCKKRISIINYKEPELEDCFYRMLKPHEIQLAMAFDSDYIVLGSGKDKVKQLGNAVTPPAMEWLVQQVIESLN